MKKEMRIDMMERYIIYSAKHRISWIVVLLFFASCTEILQLQTIGDVDLHMEFSAEYPLLVRATDEGFTDGDQIGVYVGDYNGDEPPSLSNVAIRANNILFRYDVTTRRLLGSTAIYWKDRKTPVDVVGYYPYNESIENPTAYSFFIDTRQDRTSSHSEIGGYEASDLIWAKSVKAMPEGGSINLMFSHLMAGVTVVLQKGEGFDDDEWASLDKNVIIRNSATSTNVNLETGSVEPANAGDASVLTLPYNGSFKAVVIPKMYESGSDILTIAIGNQNYDFRRQEVLTLQSGKMHSFVIKVNKRQEGGDYNFTLIDENIESWIDDGELHDGIVREYTVVHVNTPGTLSKQLSEQGIDYKRVRSLKVSGKLNDTDLYFLGGMPVLQSLNMKEIIILEYGSNQYSGRIPPESFRESLISHLILPDRLKSIGERAFMGVPLVGTLVFPEGLEEIESSAFFSSSSTNVGMFRVEFPSTLKRIGSWAFGGNGCSSSLTGELKFHNGLEEIGDYAFHNGHNISGSLELPESLVKISDAAFSGCNFTGDLTISGSVKIIPASCFQGCSFDGNLILRDGVMSVKELAFAGCMFRGELALPSTVREVGFGAFASNNFSSIALPEKLQLLGGSAFSSCAKINGQIRIPASIESIPKGCFQDCQMISSVVLHKNINNIEEDAFRNNNSIKTIVLDNPTPPILSPYAFRNVIKTQINVEVPKDGLKLYKNDRIWREFTRLTEYRDFVCRPSHVCALTESSSHTLVLNANGNWKVSYLPDWVALSKTEGSLKSEIVLTFNELPVGNSLREDKIVFQIEGGQETTCDLSQYAYEYAEDQLVQIQKHTKGKGISIYFVGDGWDAESIASGQYMELCRHDMEYFFALPPYDRLRDYFDVYVCIALSQETGVSTMNVSHDTKFDTIYSGGMDSACEGNSPRLLPYEKEIFAYIGGLTGRRTGKDFHDGDMWESLIVLIPNTTDYPGTTYYYDDGSTISICPPSNRQYPNDTRGVIQHEAGGHGFGKLADESVLKNEFIPATTLIEEYHSKGWFQNISVTGGQTNLPWARLIYDARYSDYVDVFEGAYGYTRGVWRSEANSCMSSYIPYYNAISRLDITRRVLIMAGEYFDIERDFYRVDTNEWGPVDIPTGSVQKK